MQSKRALPRENVIDSGGTPPRENVIDTGGTPPPVSIFSLPEMGSNLAVKVRYTLGSRKC